MNIFITDEDPIIAARNLCDKHVPKMLLESTQLLSNAVNVHGTSTGQAPYKQMYMSHPCTKWVIASKGNFDWLIDHAMEINLEYSARFGKVHACETHLNQIIKHYETLTFPKTGREAFIYVMPTIYRTGLITCSYRSYIKDAKTFAKWNKGRREPTWFAAHHIEYNEEAVREYIKNKTPIPQLAFSRYRYPID